MNSLATKIINVLTHQAVVCNKQQLAEHTFHVKIGGESLKDLQYLPGQHLHVLVRPIGSGTLLDATKNRTYSVWNYNPDQAIIDLAICTFSKGIGAQWVKRLVEGEVVNFIGPTGKFTVDHGADRYFFVGDISSLPHFYELRRALDPFKKVDSLIYCNDKSDLFPDLDGNYHFRCTANGSNILSEFRAMLLTMQKDELQNTLFYIAGNGHVCVSINKLLIDLYNVSRRMVRVKPFWVNGKTGL